MLSELISGFVRMAPASRSSSVIPCPPPVVMLTTALQLCLMRGRNSMNTSGLGVGLPSSGFRAWRWMMVAPASAASIDCSAISDGVNGRCGDIVGV